MSKFDHEPSAGDHYNISQLIWLSNRFLCHNGYKS